MRQALTILAIGAFATSAIAQTPVAGALGAPAQAKAAAPSAAATVRPGSGGGGDAAGELAAAIAAGDACKAVALGANPQQVYTMRRAIMPPALQQTQSEPNTIAFIRTPAGGLGVAYKTATGGGMMTLGNARLPGGHDTLPTAAEFNPPPPPSPPTPEQLALAVRVMAGLSAPEAGQAMLDMVTRTNPTGYDPATAQYVRGFDGSLYIGMRSPAGPTFTMPIKGVTNFPGLANLPLANDVFISPALAAARANSPSQAATPQRGLC